MGTKLMMTFASLLCLAYNACFAQCDTVQSIKIIYVVSPVFTFANVKCDEFEKVLVSEIKNIVITDKAEIDQIMNEVFYFKENTKFKNGPDTRTKLLIDYGCKIDVVCLGVPHGGVVEVNGELKEPRKTFQQLIPAIIKKYDPKFHD